MDILTADNNQKITKLINISKRAQFLPETVFNNIGYVIDMDMLRVCFKELSASKAIGADGVTKTAYGAKLEDNLTDLLARIRREGYKPQASRIVEIPKEDGSTRPLAISCFEDKIVQLAVAKILTAIYEPVFLPCSYGYRPGISAHGALRSLREHSNKNPDGITVEIDLRRYFDSIPHEMMRDILAQKITDKRFLKLVMTLIRAPKLVNGKGELNRIGCPQGSIISPIISNIYLHFVIDSWFTQISKTHMKGSADLVRFCDDMVFVFQLKEDAEKFYKVLPKRLEKFGLKLHEDKSSMIRSGDKAASKAAKVGKKLPTYKFLGFTCYWGKARNGNRWRLKFRSRSDRRRAKLKGLRKFLRQNLNQDTKLVIEAVKRVVKGWINYHAISDNWITVHKFIQSTQHQLFYWINRRGGKHKANWDRFEKFLDKVGYKFNFKTTSMFTSC